MKMLMLVAALVAFNVQAQTPQYGAKEQAMKDRWKANDKKSQDGYNREMEKLRASRERTQRNLGKK